MNWTLTPCGKKDQEMTDMGYPVYPPSLYRAVSYAAGLGIPIYIMVHNFSFALKPISPKYIVAALLIKDVIL